MNLVQKIEDRKIVKSDPEAVRDLYKSLALGPTIVKGYFDADSKRLGPAYTIGDYDSQGQLRDVLLSLKTLVGDLSDVLIEDKEVDFAALQDASDTCRVNAGVCLGQLSQRLADPMRMHLNNPPPQYMSAAPSMSSPGLHYSSSRSTHSSSGGRFPMTPDPYRQIQSLSPQYQSRRMENEREYLSHRRNDTATSIQEGYAGNWSGTSQLFTERDADELSMRRPSSTLLSAEDGALLSPGFSKDARPKDPLLPGQQDLDRDSYTSYYNGNQQEPTSANPPRERYGPDDYFPSPIEQHGPFFPERASGQSFSSYASRAASSNQGDSNQTQEDAQVVRPEPLRVPQRTVVPPQPHQFQPHSAPPRKPVPAAPYEAFTGHPPINKQMDLPVRMPTHIDGQRIPIPPRSDSRPKQSTPAALNGAVELPQSGPPPAFMPSLPVQRAMQSSMARRHHKEVSVDSASPFSPQSPVPQQLPALDKTASTPTPIGSPQTPVPDPNRGFSLLLLPENQYYYQRDQNIMTSTSPQQAVGSSMTKSQHASPSSRTQSDSPADSRPASQRTNLSAEVSSQSRAVAAVRTASLQSIPVPQNLPLNLPNEKNTHPFCKSAFRLFLGITKKSFIAANRPVGMTGYVPYWKCDKCQFEGPMATVAGPPDKKGRPGKPEKVFDRTIRECGPLTSAVVGPDGRGEGSGGIRYKWAFLAKCHVPLKAPPDFGNMGQSTGTIGSFGCLFCTAEGAARGWVMTFDGSRSMSLGLNGPGLNDTASTFSGTSGHSAGSGPAQNTPVFGNLQLFMDHLQMHRREEYWPCEEMRGRMKCVVGRVADRGEDWEINFLPL